MVRVTAVRTTGGTSHEHITDLRWMNPANAEVGTSTKQAIVEWLRQPDARAFVADGTTTVEVGVVEATPPYVRTYADGRWTNNLLALPRF